MDVILVDTSVLVNFLKGHSSPSSTYLKNNISSVLLTTCPVIVQEVLQGVLTDKIFNNTRSFFDDTIQFSGSQYELAVEAAALYRKLRNHGVTVRKPNDCLIAIYAIKNNVPLLHDDKDFDHIAKYSDLQVVETK